MGDKITIEMDKEFMDWWNSGVLSPHIQDDQTYMLIAWKSWEACIERTK